MAITNQTRVRDGAIYNTPKESPTDMIGEHPTENILEQARQPAKPKNRKISQLANPNTFFSNTTNQNHSITVVENHE